MSITHVDSSIASTITNVSRDVYRNYAKVNKSSKGKGEIYDDREDKKGMKEK
jgi:hypothetical protein